MYTITVIVTVTVSSQYSSNTDIDCLAELNNNVNGQLTLRLGEIDGGDNVCILGGPKIQQVTQSTEGSTAGFLGDD